MVALESKGGVGNATCQGSASDSGALQNGPTTNGSGASSELRQRKSQTKGAKYQSPRNSPDSGDTCNSNKQLENTTKKHWSIDKCGGLLLLWAPFDAYFMHYQRYILARAVHNRRVLLYLIIKFVWPPFSAYLECH